MELGKQIWIGIEKGLTAMSFGMYAILKEICFKAWDGVVGWVREKFGGSTTLMKSATVGAASVAALGLPGVAAASTAPAVQAPKLPAIAAPAIQAPKLPAIAALDSKPIRIDSRPPLGANLASAPPAAQAGPINITINTAPGMDAKAIASAVSAELDRRQGSAAARRRATLGDIA